MGSIKEFEKEKLIMGFLYSDRTLFSRFVEKLVPVYGAVDFTSSEIDFTFTDYYNREMGTSIKRVFCSFDGLIDPSRLGEIKVASNLLEEEFMKDGKRPVNCDPGLLNLSRLILASTKNNVHRIPLSHGIYGEVTLLYMKKRFRNLFWTYHDYRTPEYKEVFAPDT